MKKVLCIVGSRDKKSKGLEFTLNLENYFLDEPSIDFNILKISDYKLNPSSGKNEYFITGKDRDESGDDSIFIKKQILEADFILFHSPVYSLNVSSDIKKLIDRLSPWGHLYRLLGKPTITLVTGTGNGHLEVEGYLDFILQSFGVKIIDNITITTKEDLKDFQYSKLAESIIQEINKSSKFEISSLIGAQFVEQQQKVRKQPKDYYEHLYWLEKGFFNYKDLQKYIDNEINI